MALDVLPRFLQPAAPPMGAAGGAFAAAGGAAPSQQLLANVSMTGQEQTNWCWSAVTQTVQGWATRVFTQSDIATGHITHNGRAASCAAPNGGDANDGDCASGDACGAWCNDPHILSVVLGENGVFSGYITEGRAPTFDNIVTEIKAQRPVPCRVQWAGGGGHFIVVFGWTIDATGARLVHVLDPARADAGAPVPEKVVLFDDFISAYELSGGRGTINYSYEVQSNV